MDNEITINPEEIRKQPDGSITDCETIRQIALYGIRNNDNSLYCKINQDFAYCGLYPFAMKSFDEIPEIKELWEKRKQDAYKKWQPVVDNMGIENPEKKKWATDFLHQMEENNSNPPIMPIVQRIMNEIGHRDVVTFVPSGQPILICDDEKKEIYGQVIDGVPHWFDTPEAQKAKKEYELKNK